MSLLETQYRLLRGERLFFLTAMRWRSLTKNVSFFALQLLPHYCKSDIMHTSNHYGSESEYYPDLKMLDFNHFQVVKAHSTYADSVAFCVSLNWKLYHSNYTQMEARTQQQLIWLTYTSTECISPGPVVVWQKSIYKCLILFSLFLVSSGGMHSHLDISQQVPDHQHLNKKHICLDS